MIYSTTYFFKKNIETTAYRIDPNQPWLTNETCNLGYKVAIKSWNPCRNKLGSLIIINQILRGKKRNN
jgi:hypothetical protein